MATEPSAAIAFRDAPRGDRGQPRRVRCLNPFRWLEINAGGEITPCCSPWFKGALGSLKEQSLQEIWNGPRFREAREAMLHPTAWRKFCNPETCPHIQNDTWVYVDFITPETPDSLPLPAAMLEAVQDGRTDLPFGPAQIGISCDSRCNLRCIRCARMNNPGGDAPLLRKALEGVRTFLPSLQRLKLMGDGEVFAVPETKEFLTQFDSAAYPQLQFLIHTNGVLLTPEMWERIKHIRVDWLVVSIDAATRGVYEKIRRGGDWGALQRNLEFLAARRREGAIRDMRLCFCVMKSNCGELLAFAQMGERLGVDCVFYIPILGDYGEEQIFGRKDPAALWRIVRQLRDPRMQAPNTGSPSPGIIQIDANALNSWRSWRPRLRDWPAILRSCLMGRR